MTEDKTETPTIGSPAETGRPRRRAVAAVGIGGALIVGVLAAIGFGRAGHDTSLVTKVAPAPIAKLQASDSVAAKGDVAEIFGNKFVLQDASGRALVDTGPDGEGRELVTKGETVDVQGRFARGELRAVILTLAVRSARDDVEMARAATGNADVVIAGALDLRGQAGHVRLRARDRIGLGPQPDMAGLTAQIKGAGYDDIRIAGRGPRHLDVVARGSDGKDHDLHVDFDGRIREKSVF